jgi:hypothetical protein
MKRLLIVLCIVLVGVVFSFNLCDAACPFQDGPYITVYKYWTGEAKVQEVWECVHDLSDYVYGNAVCFFNQVDNSNNTQTICISGDFKILYPLDW